MKVKANPTWRAVYVCLVAFAAALLAQPRVGAQARVPAPVDDGDRVALNGNVHPLARVEFDRGAAPDNLPAERVLLVLRPSPERQAALETLLAEQKNPGSPNYHRWVTPNEFGERYGASVDDLKRVGAWLGGNGFSVDRVAPGRRVIEFSGTAGQVRAAFRTPIHKFVVGGQEHWGNTREPQIPRELSTVVAGIRSLHNFETKPTSRPAGVFRRNQESGKIERVADKAPQFTYNLSGQDFWPLGPTDFATIYNVTPLWNTGIDGTGQTIAIVQRSNINPSDVADFRTLFGLPANPPTITLNGPDPGITADESEALIDVEWSGAVAKGATINMIVSKSTNTTDGVDLSVDYAVQNNVAPIMSTSFGLCELFLGNAGNAFYASEWQQAAAQGITSVVATGDSGSGGCDPQGARGAVYGWQVNGLASTPYNVAVGGTDFLGNFKYPGGYWSPTNDPTTQASALSYIPETVWNDSCASSLFPGIPAVNCNNPVLGGAPPFTFLNVTGGGGGKSNCSVATGSLLPEGCIGGYPRPSWQAGPSMVRIDGRRDVPDVSLFAGDGLLGSFYIVCQSDLTLSTCDLNSPFGDFAGFGGTSVAAPAFAGIMALVNQSTGSTQGNPNYDFYKLAAAQPLKGCFSSSGSGSACVFNDVTNGNNEMPCARPSLNCFGQGALGAGVLTAFQAGLGYDRASGLGSVNAANLVNKWPVSTAAFALPTYTVSELSATGPTIKVNRVGSAVEPLYVTWAVSGGTGTLGADFKQATGNLTLAAGATAGTFVFPVLHDFALGDHTVQLSLYPAPGGTPSTTTVTVTNADLPGTIQFRTSALVAPTRLQGPNTVYVYLTRTGGSASGITVDFAATDGTAINPADYTVLTTPATVTFGAHSANERIAFQVVRQTHATNPKFTVTLSNPGSGATLGPRTTATVTILEK